MSPHASKELMVKRAPLIGNCPRPTLSSRSGPFDGETGKFGRDVNTQ
jgi:hypothetical protein